MQVYHLLSLSAIIAFSIAIFSCKRVPRNKNDIVYIAQVIGYLLMAISMVCIGQYAAMVAFISCAITLWLKMKKNYTAIKFLTFWLLTLIISLIVNGKGWVGMLPVVASLDIIFRHTSRYRAYLPKELFPRYMWDYVDKRHYIDILSEIDNANRERDHALALLMENIVDVILLCVFSWMIHDYLMFVWRIAMLLVNTINYLKRLLPALNRVMCSVIPDPHRTKRRIYPGRTKKFDWHI